MRRSAKILGSVLLLLLVVTSLIWYAAFREDHGGRLTVSFLNVGQGDSIFIQTSDGRQILIDGGPDDSVLRQLGSFMPFYDRTIDLVIATAETPAKVSGLTNVLARYGVSTIIRSAARSGTPQAQSFDGAVARAQTHGTRLLVLRRGQTIDLGGSTYLEVFFPDRDASGMSASDGCLVLKLLFGNTAFLFACGSGPIENYMATLDGSKLEADVLSATGDDSELFVGFVSPQYAVVPCNANASSSAFSRLDVQTVDTCNGTVTFVSDGQIVTRE
jgi:competence protein ComEC